MAIFRVIKDKENPYIMVNKYYIHDNRLSLKAKGLMSYFLSRPDDWEFYQNEIMKHCTDKRDSLSNAINELIVAGYIERSFKRGECGKLKGGYDYAVHEIPVIINNEENACTQESTESGFPESGETRNRENPNSGNPPLLNKELIPNKELKLNKETTTKGKNEEINSCSSSITKIFKHFEQCNFGLLSPILMEKIEADVEIYGETFVMRAAEVADEQGKHKYSYVKGILENWKVNGGMKNSKRGEKNAGSEQGTKELEDAGLGFTV
ncbi:DnaD domain protein [Clostridium algidicarnis]|uniref:DnaD domain protein n=1 Tax=Clostridium algidicarnis TaxID=37659 RepID=UPI001C0CFC2F|nr:DnaD domain protein [Clostridium algidicarnis]MBU3205175.1 DnaD domain protein [Clostridium algidicarnis]MBU3213328.1 DnaD domain protein [Clostridium algidicarnis]MBU3223777.1 DnaD domain protein [Clostridium algidicarnis]